ncbi:hypothetical protein HYALB_00001109 [Hymenoscyphus albidus]|uniref:U-box domain-containing protein n=1 Tax=Hymenoscyphus albidus TaxID=595503 RepID=A0A9N9Q3R8_9HELO|nr:hypothetical protein HYALB_00001109 [Hymenoscyphus albidus]
MDSNDQQPPPPPEAPDKEKMDQIRQRRMQKLGGSSASTSNPEGPAEGTALSSNPQASSSTPNPPANVEPAQKTRITIKSASSSAATENPFAKLTAQASTGPKITVRKAEERSMKRTRAELDEIQYPSAPLAKRPATGENMEDWENRVLSQLFRLTLDSDQQVDSSNHRLIYLPNLRSELEEEKLPLRLTKDRLDSAILEAASTIPAQKSVLDYLLPCWKRVIKAQRAQKVNVTGRDEVLKEARRLCMSHCIFAAEMPELYGRESNPATDSLTPHFLFEAAEDKGICPDFLIEAVSRFEEDDTVKLMLTKAVAGLSLQLSNMTMNDNYKPYINALKQLAQFSKIVVAIAADPLFQMATSAPGIESHTLLGPFFRISPLQKEVCKEYFASPKSMDKSHIRTSQEALRLTLQTHQRDLLDITNSFVKAGPASRNKILDWFAYIVNSNHKRRAMRPDKTQLSSDGFLINVTVVLDGLCEPFMDTTFSKISRIEPEYLRRNPRVNIADETKLNADQEASDEFYKVQVGGASNFISEVFFLNLAAHHYGSEATNGGLKSLDKDIKYLQSKLEEFERERSKYASNPVQAAQFEAQFKKYNDILMESMQTKLAIEGVLFDKSMQTKSLLFMRYVTVWLLRVATQSEYTPDKTIQLPLKSEQPDIFKFLPEYVLEDIVGNFNFIFRASSFMPDVMISAFGDEIIVFCITFLTNSEYIKNPYLKAKLVSLLFHGTWPVYHRTKGILGDSLVGTKFANDHLLHALIKFYIEVESTGAHTQFYDKFNIRYEIFQVIKCIWTNDVYKQRLTQESKTNIEFFLRFVNLLLNDATYVLDEALTKFPKIHDLQRELDDTSLDPEARTAKEEELKTAEGQAQQYMQLTNETVSMMKLFTKNLSGSFTMPEIVDRVAAMVDYTLDTIVGPKSANLKVKDPQKYHFEPRTLLSEFIDIYLNLGVSEEFVNAVARDGRSYKPENFDNASRILQRYNMRSGEDIAKWENLKKKFAIAKQLEDENEGDLGEIPDEFADPIMAILMENPVILPTSKQTLDRSTILTHLLSDPHDPFNRMALKIEDVVEDLELKERVRVWKAGRIAAGKMARKDKMDESEG